MYTGPLKEEQRQITALEVLDFIELTENFSRDFMRYSIAEVNSESNVCRRYAEQIKESMGLINYMLRAIGGIATTFEDDSGTTHNVILGEWYGRDRNDAANHLWRPLHSANPGQYYSIEASDLDRFRSELLTQLIESSGLNTAKATGP